MTPRTSSMEEQNPSETSRLVIMPSPNLTDNVSTQSLLADTEPGLGGGNLSGASLYSHNSDIQLQTFSRRQQDDDSDYHGSLSSRRRKFTVRIVMLIGAIAVLGGMTALRHQGQGTTGSSIPVSPPFVPFFQHDVILTGVAPFSTKDPVNDIGLYEFDRPKDSKPPKSLQQNDRKTRALPTNSWYQNLIMVDGEPSPLHRVYSIPYLIDAAGSIPGLRFFANHIMASTSIVQVYSVEEYGLVLGAGIEMRQQSQNHDKPLSNGYTVEKMTDLGITLKWNEFPMTSSIVKGMPYVTMTYDTIEAKSSYGDTMVPTIYSQKPVAADPIADKSNKFKCDGRGVVDVQKEIELLIAESDFSWLVFFSEPVTIRCNSDSTTGMSLQIVDTSNGQDDEGKPNPLVVRVAWLKSCSTGGNPIYCHQELMLPSALMLGQGLYGDILRNHSNFYPGPDARFTYTIDDSKDSIVMTFDWDARSMSQEVGLSEYPLITYALPHHFDLLEAMPTFDSQIYCVATLIGPACLLGGNKWQLTEDLPEIGMRAPRPPAPWALASLAESVRTDLRFTLPRYYKKGAGDTYFSGKRMAKLARIIAIADELVDVCTSKPTAEYVDACNGLKLPQLKDINHAVDELRESVEIWFNGKAVTPFVYDSAWGGVVSCGCDFDDKTKSCKNHFPDNCPAFTDPGLDFGNGFFNDHHFHYGYMIQAAAVLSHFDHEWGRENFEKVLLLIRDIANPSDEDEWFPRWRQKDWYQGHSWASGIATLYMNGKNQESSSESIAAYEAIALYGKVMTAAWEDTSNRDEIRVAKEIQAAGMVATATELQSTKKYWHIIRGGNEDIKIYPQNYVEFAVGMLWQTMTQFQTWFGSAPYLAYGIQLLPLTPISEARDGVEWAKMMYHSLAESCFGDKGCTESGWGVGVLAILATVGHQKMAMNQTLMMPKDAFGGPAGDGHSLSNTLWYISTRPAVTPIELDRNKHSDSDAAPTSPVEYTLTDCGRPSTCTDFVLDTIAGLYSCRQRMQWLIWQEGKTEAEACGQVAGIENAHECGPCNPIEGDDDSVVVPSSQCSACTESQCNNELLNRCPRYLKTFVCTDGPSRGGCSPTPWDLHNQCTACCELSACKQRSIEKQVIPVPTDVNNSSQSDQELSPECPHCLPDVCKSRVNQCPVGGGAPYLCYEGDSKGGCAPEPWAVGTRQCAKCCKVTEGC